MGWQEGYLDFCSKGGRRTLCSRRGEGGGYTTQKVTIKSLQMTFYVGKKSFRNFILKNGIVKAIFVDVYLDPGKKFSGQARGGSIKCPAGGG